jgi:AcrR family transcriptional regulator
MPRVDRRTFNSRDDILDAAQRVAARDGAGHVTLDAVARESGLSKGGVLYNFPSKDALIQGMLERLLTVYREKVDDYREKLKDETAPTIQAVLASKREIEIDPKVSMAILTAAAQKPELLDPLREACARQFTHLCEETKDPDLAMLMWAAADGLMFQTLLGYAPYPADHKDALFAKLQALAREVLK